nr:hypothetical protein Iba_chr02bCG9060 [Ipomoea batatas]
MEANLQCGPRSQTSAERNGVLGQKKLAGLGGRSATQESGGLRIKKRKLSEEQVNLLEKSLGYERRLLQRKAKIDGGDGREKAVSGDQEVEVMAKDENVPTLDGLDGRN